MNTNYVIKRAEISDFRRKVKDVITNYNNALDSLESTIKGTIDDLGMQGKSAENIKRYLTDIHINAFIKSIRSIMDTYYNNLIMFEYGYMLIDGTVMNGTWGETPTSVKKYLSEYKTLDKDGNEKNAFYITSTTNDDPTIINNFSKGANNFVASIYNDKTTINGQIHTVNINKVDNRYYVHNGKMDGKVSKGYNTLYDAIIDIQGDGKGKPLEIIKVINNTEVNIIQ